MAACINQMEVSNEQFDTFKLQKIINNLGLHHKKYDSEKYTNTSEAIRLDYEDGSVINW